MQRKLYEKKKTRGQVRGESAERVNGAPVYTATYKVNRSDTLLEFLLKKCNTSRNNVKSLLVRRQVLVNGSVVTQYDFPLAKDDEVKLARKPVREGETSKKPSERVVKPRVILKKLYEDDAFLAVEKPAGLLSVESDKETECAYGYVLKEMQKADKNARPYVLHRIDKETSGVLIFAKDIKVHSKMKLRWNEQVTAREYYAVVEGVLEEKSGTITSFLKENANNLVYSTNDPTGQKAVTHYEVIRENPLFSLLKVKIDTGRKNQIRVHMQTLGHPVVGDTKYGHTKDPLKRLGLHASKLEFIHPDTKEIVSVVSAIPLSFRALFG